MNFFLLELKTESVRCCLCANKSPGQTSEEFESFPFFNPIQDWEGGAKKAPYQFFFPVISFYKRRN